MPGIRYVPVSRTFTSLSLHFELQRCCPQILVYAARGSATFFSFLRARLLQAYCPEATVVLLGLQTRRHPAWQQWIIRRLAPALVCVQSEANRDYLVGLGCRVALLPSGVDTATFQPVDSARRQALRAAYGLDPARPVVLHVGHLNEGRGVRVLADLAASGACQAVLVASSSTPQEAALGAELRAAGVTVLNEYLPRIEELYQLADCYVFPVATTDNAIEAPLSVLEALACNLPVVTMRFGGLPRMFAGVTNPGLVFVDAPPDIVPQALRLCDAGPSTTRELVLPYSWDAIAAELLSQALAAAHAPDG